MLALLDSAGIVPQYDTENNMTLFWQTPEYCVELVGDIARPAALEFVNGEYIVIMPEVKSTGYHANLRWIDDATAPEFEGQITPQFPKRVWA